MDELTALHMKHGYYIDISKTANGCIVKSPANILLVPQHLPETTIYKIEDHILNINNNDYAVPNYAVRSIILTDILMKMTQLNMPLSLVVFFDGLTQKKSLTEIINPPDDESDRKKDVTLLQSLSKIMLGEIDSEDAKKMGIGIGFQLIFNICKKGGI